MTGLDLATGRALDRWAAECGVQRLPREPDNAFRARLREHIAALSTLGANLTCEPLAKASCITAHAFGLDQTMFDLEQHLKRQIAFSRGTFGPGKRRAGVIKHIGKELAEIEDGKGDPNEWVDVVILALDGLTRELMSNGMSTDHAARIACELIVQKQATNERREWPDWRTASETEAIEHVRS